jgi:IclR family pca regulon transcriptional regulator
MTIAKPDFIEGIAKGMAVLESFDTERQRLNATLAAERAGLTRAAARRHLLTLAHLGYLETDGSCASRAATWRRRGCRGRCSRP